jgi:hypothetical protein
VSPLLSKQARSEADRKRLYTNLEKLSHNEVAKLVQNYSCAQNEDESENPGNNSHQTQVSFLTISSPTLSR